MRAEKSSFMLMAKERQNFWKDWRMEYDLLIREAEAQDASAVIALLDQIGQETSYQSGWKWDCNEWVWNATFFWIRQAQSDNQITLLAFLNDELVGIINTTADQRPRARHIGDVFFRNKKSLLGKWSR